MVLREFRKHTRDQAPELNKFTTELRSDKLMPRLQEAIERSRRDDPRRDILEKLYQALNREGGHLVFRYEPTLPLYPDYEQASFNEALITLEDADGVEIHGGKLLDAIHGAHNGHDVGLHFRLWLIFAQITDFTMHKEGERLSINIMPADTDAAPFRETLRQGLEIAQRESSNEIILEAVENKFWNRERREYLKGLTDTGIALAIDDYGAPEGFNNSQMLERFNNGRSPGDLIVKLDGQLVRAFIDENDLTILEKLKEIQEQCPSATVVAEWVKDADEARALMERLNGFGIGRSIHLVQSRTITDSNQLFLSKIHGNGSTDRRPQP
jgi:EAL domain-containing protein (putative c-di-GMP-specific phosphodiesterase class I)